MRRKEEEDWGRIWGAGRWGVVEQQGTEATGNAKCARA